MNGREMFHWNVQLQSSDGQVTNFPISSFWSPEKEGTETALMLAAKGMAHYQAGGKMQFAALGITRV